MVVHAVLNTSPQFFAIDWQTVGIAAFAFTIWPILATYAKRFHDLGWSGWWSLLLFIPIVNIAVLLYLGMQEGELERNEHGPAPS